jgi:hypothetical protein
MVRYTILCYNYYIKISAQDTYINSANYNIDSIVVQLTSYWLSHMHAQGVYILHTIKIGSVIHENKKKPPLIVHIIKRVVSL